MNGVLYESLFWGIAVLAFFSCIAVTSWVKNRRQERESYYRSEAIKKVAEMQGATPEPVLALLREALAPSPRDEGPNIWASPGAYIREREAFYRAETLKKLAESQGGGTEAVLQYFREEERKAQRRIRGGLRLAGLITSAVGIGITVFLYVLQPIPDMPVYLAGLIPTLVGVALLAYSYMLMEIGAAR